MTRGGLHINGRFLTQRISGVQRYARELLTAFDGLLADDPALANHLGPVPVWYPKGPPVIDPPHWRVLVPTALPGFSGHSWEQVTLGRKARGGFLVSLCGSGPLLCRSQLVVFHDANTWTIPEAFSRPYRAFHRFVRPRLANRVRRIGTVSSFSAGELATCLGVPQDRFTVIYNSAEHILTPNEDPETLTRYGLEPGQYLFAAGNQSPNKNIARLIQARQIIGPGAPTLAIAGGFTTGVSQADTASSDGVMFLGRVTDEELRVLYAQSRAFVFPSLYEGFGIPPLEAMALGTPVLSSNSSAMPEVLGDAVKYFDPTDATAIAACIKDFIALPDRDRHALAMRGQERAGRFSWTTSAHHLLDLVLQETGAGRA